MSRILLPLAAAAALLAVPTTAAAATVSVRPDPDLPAYDEVHVVAAPGEANRIRITHAADARSVTVRDVGAPLEPGTGCVPSGARAVVCTAREDTGARQWLAAVRVEAGDGDDEVASEGPAGALTADGGAGDDELAGGRVNDRLTGGPGADRLLGGPGNDILLDGDAAAAADAFDGGPDADELSYAGRATAVMVDLRPGAAAASGEGDAIAGIEHLTGGAGHDRLTGDDAGNRLTGGRGRDRLAAGAGDDTVEPGAGADAVACGAGLDLVPGTKRADRVRRSCERVVLRSGALTLPLDPALQRDGRRALRLAPFRCPWDEASDQPHACRGKVVVRQAGGERRRLAVGRFRREGDADARERMRSLRLALTPRGRRALRGGAKVTVQVRGERVPRGGWTVRIPARR